jgi:hypothetical protein
MPKFSVILLLALSACAQREAVYSPETGVLCDQYVCANDNGISRELTQRHLGEEAANRVFSQGEFDLSKFTFANGIFCDVQERLCRVDRYFDAQGQRSAVSQKYTDLLFVR